MKIFSLKKARVMPAKKYTIDEVRAIVEPFAKKYGVERIYMFGSYARGDSTDNSDVDLRVDKGSLHGMFALSGLYTEIQEALQIKVDLLTTGSLDDDFLRKIQKEEVLIYEEQSKMLICPQKPMV
jgi:predicted nucleotidyltransferase